MSKKGKENITNVENPKSFDEFYKKTINKNPSLNIQKFFINKYNEKLKGNTAIDLGCGAGNDTKFLISKEFKVTAIDKEENVRDILKNIQSQDLKIIIGDFSKIKLPKSDLVNANFSLPFITENFEDFLKDLLDTTINPSGFFVGNFLGKQDDWNKGRTTIEKNKLIEFFKDFNILYYSEEKYYKDTIDGRSKFWHIHNIIAQKR